MLKRIFSLICLIMVTIFSQSFSPVPVYGSAEKKAKKLNDTIQGPAYDTTSLKNIVSQLDATEIVIHGHNGISLNPNAVSFVKTFVKGYDKEYTKMRSWATPYFTVIDRIFTQHEIPTQLKYVAVIESKLKSSAVSYVGAVGVWQFMPSTARFLGLKITRYNDERTDFQKSTHAAAKYFKDLYNIYGDWLLVIAAYNSGPGYVNSAIRRSGSRNFWKLQHLLPAETRKHVKKFIGTHYYFEGNGSVATLTKEEAEAQIGFIPDYLVTRKLSYKELELTTGSTVSGKYVSSVIAKYVNMDNAEFERYNPEFDRIVTEEESVYELKLPAGKMQLFQANKFAILNESVQHINSFNTELVGTREKPIEVVSR